MNELIWKQDAINAADRTDYTGLAIEDVKKVTDEVIKELKQLPPVHPKRGKWLPDNRCGGGYWVCSSCKHPTEAFAADVLYKYCPFCGADMRGEQDE